MRLGYLGTCLYLLVPTCRTVWEVGLRDAGDALEVVVARVAEVCRAEAEEDSDRAAVPALVLKEVRPVLRAHLQIKQGRLSAWRRATNKTRSSAETL